MLEVWEKKVVCINFQRVFWILKKQNDSMMIFFKFTWGLFAIFFINGSFNSLFCFLEKCDVVGRRSYLINFTLRNPSSCAIDRFFLGGSVFSYFRKKIPII